MVRRLSGSRSTLERPTMQAQTRKLRVAVGGLIGLALVLTVALTAFYSQPSSLGRIFLP
jgi:hypothetical protein